MGSDRLNRRIGRMVPGMAALVCMLTAGCQYHWGSLMHSQLSSMAVGVFENATREPGLSAVLQAKLNEETIRDGSLSLVAREDADCVLEGEIQAVNLSHIASVKTSDARVRDDDQDKYQSAIYRVEVTISYRLMVPGYQTPLVASQTITGTADFSRLPDMRVARQEALATALHDAAVKIIAAVTEAW